MNLLINFAYIYKACIIIKAIDLLKLLVICLISKRKMVRHQYQKIIISACLFVTEVLLIKANFNSCIPNSIEFRYNNTDPCVLLQLL